MRVLTIAMLGYLAALGSARSATGTITANPNPCQIAAGAHACTTYLAWSTEGVQQARVTATAEGKGGTLEKEFASGRTCAKCGANWIEAGARYVFRLVDFSSGKKGAVLATVTVTATNPHGEDTAGSGVITAAPNPCRIPPSKVACTTYLAWSSEGIQDARVYVKSTGKTPFPEKEFGTGRSCAKCGASWIEAGTRYLFVLYDFSTGSRGHALSSVVVSAIK